MSQGLETLVGRMTVADLAARAGTTIDRIVGAALGASSAPSTKQAAQKSLTKPAKKKSTKATPSTAPNASNVPRGGLALDAVLASLASVGGPAKLEDVRAKTGGSIPQVRSALQRLAKARKVTITGERRSTRYAVK